MERLKNTRVYLAGPVERDEACAPWRDQISEKLAPMGIDIWSPLNYPEWFSEACGGNISPELQRGDKEALIRLVKNYQWAGDRRLDRNQVIRDTCLRLVSASDWVICKVGGPTVGTFEELAIARQQGKPILFFSDEEDLDSCWRAAQFYNNDRIWFNSMDELMDEVKSIHSGDRNVDRLSWIFIKDFGWNLYKGQGSNEY